MKITNSEEIFEREPSVTDFTVDNKCSNCGNCCNDIIPLTNADINRIKQYIKKNNIQEVQHAPHNCFVKVNYDAMCPFRDEVHKCCTIYPVRPIICKSFICNDGEELFKISAKFYYQLKKQSCREVFFS